MEVFIIDIALKLSYLGLEAYSGFQKQPNVITIEKIVCDSLVKANINFIEDSLQYAGRTDKGVHAWDQTIKIKISSNIIPPRLLSRINSYLPKWIKFWSYAIVSENFSPRFDALLRHYSYFYISNNIHKLNFKQMNKGAKILIGTHNFEFFSKKEIGKEDFTKTITNIEILKLNEHQGLLIKVSGKSFLWQMVRRIVSHLVQLGMNYIDENETLKLLNLETEKKPDPLPAWGLILEKIDYSETLNWTIEKSVILKIRKEFQNEFHYYLQKLAVFNHFLSIQENLLEG